MPNYHFQQDIQCTLKFRDTGQEEDFVIESPNGEGVFEADLKLIHDNTYIDAKGFIRSPHNLAQMVLRFDYSSHVMDLSRLLVADEIIIPYSFNDFSTTQEEPFILLNKEVVYNYFSGFVGSSRADDQIPYGDIKLEFGSVNSKTMIDLRFMDFYNGEDNPEPPADEDPELDDTLVRERARFTDDFNKVLSPINLPEVPGVPGGGDGDLEPGDPGDDDDGDYQPPAPIEEDAFVSVNNDTANFEVNGNPFRFSGTNAYYLPNYETGNHEPYVVDNFLQMCNDLDINVIRMWGFYNGDPQYDGDATLQPEPGVYHEENLKALDRIMAKLRDNNIRVILSLVNGKDEVGGCPVYNEWAGAPNPDNDTTQSWTFITGEQQQEWYRDYVEMLVNRVNTETGVAYKDDPTIFAWEIGNELNGRSPDSESQSNVEDAEFLRDWYQGMAQFIKSMDSNHMVTTGEEGFEVDGTRSDSPWQVNRYSNTYVLRAAKGSSYERNTAIPEIDFGRAHWYVNNYGWSGGWSQEKADAQEAWIQDHVNIAAQHGKPFIMCEYGIRTAWGDADVLLSHYEPFWETTRNSGAAGDLIWQLAADGVKCFEFGGNICNPDVITDRGDAQAWNAMAQHISEMNQGGGAIANPPDHDAEGAVYEWDANGVEVDSNNYLTAWHDNINGVNFDPYPNLPFWDSTNQRVIANDGVWQDMYSTGINLDANSMQLSMVIDFSVVDSSWRTILCAANSGDNESNDSGGFWIDINDGSQNRIWAGAHGNNLGYVSHDGGVVVVTLRISGGTAELIVTNSDGTSDRVSTSVGTGHAITERMAWNEEIEPGGVTEGQGSHNMNVHGIRIWDSAGSTSERDNRIADMNYDYGGSTSQPDDITAPVPGGSLSHQNIGENSFDVTFSKANDNRTAQSNLVYRLYTNTSNNLDTAANAASNGTLQDSGTDVSTLSASGLSANTTYYYNVVVEDEAGNKAVYGQSNTRTAGGDPASGDLLYEWDGDGFSTSGGNVTGWTDNINSLQMTPAGDAPLYNSDDNYVYVDARDQNLLTSGLSGLIGSNLQFSVVVDLSEFSGINWGLIAFAPSGSGDGYMGLFPTATGINVYYNGGNIISLSHNSMLSVVTFQHDGNGNVTLIIDEEDGNRAITSSSATNLYDSVTQMVFNADFNTSGGLKDNSGCEGHNLRAIRIWDGGDDDTERDNRIDDMISEYIDGDTGGDPGGGDDDPPEDTTDPTVSGGLSTSNITENSFDVSYSKATDNESAHHTLVYYLYTSTTNNLSTAGDTVNNGTLQDSGTDVSILSASGLNSDTTYYFNVVVEDEAGNIEDYGQSSVTTEAAQTEPDPEPSQGLIHEWNDQGITLVNGNEVSAWNDNVGSVNLTPPSGASNPIYDSTNGEVQFSSGQFLFSDAMDMLLDGFQLTAVIDLGNTVTGVDIINMATSGGNDYADGGIQIFARSTNTLRPSLGAGYLIDDETGNDYIDHDQSLAVVTMWHDGSTVHCYIDTENGERFTGSMSRGAPSNRTNNIVLNQDLAPSGLGSGGDGSTRIRAIKIWDDHVDSTERENRIDQMKADYLP